MKQPIDHTNLLSLAWHIVKPYLAECPTLLENEFGLLNKTMHIANTLTSPELLFAYMGHISSEPPTAPDAFFVNATVCRTAHFQQLPPSTQLAEMNNVTGIFNCFVDIFSTRNHAVKEEYRDLLEASFHNYKINKFYYLTTHDLVFESFNDLVTYFEELCTNFTFDVVITQNMVESFCALMTAVVSHHFRLKHILTPSYSYDGLLPLYAAQRPTTKDTYLFMSITVNHLFGRLQKPQYFENETPLLITYMLGQLIHSLRGSLFDFMSSTSIFNNHITSWDNNQPAKNQFTLTKGFNLGKNKIKIFSYNQSLTQFMAVIAMDASPQTMFYISPELIENNAAPLPLDLLPMFSLSRDMVVNGLNETEAATLSSLVADLTLLF